MLDVARRSETGADDAHKVLWIRFVSEQFTLQRRRFLFFEVPVRCHSQGKSGGRNIVGSVDGESHRESVPCPSFPSICVTFTASPPSIRSRTVMRRPGLTSTTS